MRRFEVRDGKSHKFWAIAVRGSEFTVTFGRIGTAGQALTKAFPSPAKARAEADKLIREKTGKGYVEVARPAAAPPPADPAAVEAAVRADPHDPAAWAALADALSRAGDPRGEFMRVQLALEGEALPEAERAALRRREADLLAARERDWLGDLAPLTDAGDADPPFFGHFSRGWLARVAFDALTVAQARALRSPACRLVRELAVAGTAAEASAGAPNRYVPATYGPGPDVPPDVHPFDGPSLHALLGNPHLAAVRVSHLGPEPGDPTSAHRPGPLAHQLVARMPHLEGLSISAERVGAAELLALPLPKLRVLRLAYPGRPYPLDVLAANRSLANLTHLLCHPPAGDPDDGPAYVGVESLRAVCRSPHLPALAHLAVRRSDAGDWGAEELVASGVLKRLLPPGCRRRTRRPQRGRA